MDKVTIEGVPVIRSGVGPKRWEEDRGEFVQISYQEEIRHLALFEIREGFTRGKHYHQKKEEIFYIVAGKIRATFFDLDTGERDQRILEKGERIRIKPACGHVFRALEDTLVVEYSPQAFDPEDNFPIYLEEGPDRAGNATAGL